MRANIPKNPPRQPLVELEGIYLQAMKEASVRLMDGLPACDELWGMLGQIETMLLEAQLREMPLSELFGNGGVAAFCQSIVDEYRADGEMILLAAQDKSVKADLRPKKPRGGINGRRHRRMTVLMATALVLLLSALALWYTGVLNYWTGGNSYYLEELHNFQSTITDLPADPITLTLPLEKTSGRSDMLYADGDGFDITFTAVDTHEHTGSFTDPETGKITYQKTLTWYLRFTYAVKSDFNRVAYVEPTAAGTVTVTLPNGETYEGKLSWISSGATENGREYASLTVIDLPADMDVKGATLTVTLDPPHLVVWERIGTGRR
ncbi:MAG: hypothetical protein J6B24_11750 [Clostridia bacterium]|nr:hypothetical protein [Clostridia bacterium]